MRAKRSSSDKQHNDAVWWHEDTRQWVAVIGYSGISNAEKPQRQWWYLDVVMRARIGALPAFPAGAGVDVRPA